jgi:SnoaL-like domain
MNGSSAARFPRSMARAVAASIVQASKLPTCQGDLRVNSAIDRDSDIRARILQHWEASERGEVEAEHAIYAADAILDYPQSGERFRGRSKIQAQRGGHPAERHFAVRRILGGGAVWVSECEITYDGVPTHSVSVMEFTDGLVTHETQYFADQFKAAAGRAALAEPIPARVQ